MDLEKAYDKMSWEFIRATLIELGFLSSLVNLIIFSIKCPTLSLLWSGEKRESFKPTHGLR